MEKTILVINPGSTSTKIAIYKDKKQVDEKIFSYSAEDLAPFPTIMSQKGSRKQQILQYLKDNGVTELSAVVGRGGAIGPVKSGAYEVNELLLDRLSNRPVGQHASNLGGVLAYELATIYKVPAYVYDGVTVDELDEVARRTGLKEVRRYSRCHALNMRASAIHIAEKLNKRYCDCNFVVVHMGGGTTMSAHKKGTMCDVLIDSEGPLSAERAGGMPVTTMLKFMARNNISPQEALRMTRGRGGMVSLLGTNDMIKVEQAAASGDKEAQLCIDTMCYQVAKGIGLLSTVLYGDVDRIILTGAVANSERITGKIIERVRFIAPVEVLPGEREMEALALGALRVLNGEEEAHAYDPETDDIDLNML